MANYDLPDPQQYATLVEFLAAERESIVHAHCAPSCGTASRARGRKVAGVPMHMQPQPLRSDDFPDGLQSLSEKDQSRVDSANASYKAMADLLELLIGWDVSVSIENPANSLFWKTSWIERQLKFFPKGHNTLLDHCMHGGSREEVSKLWSYNPLRSNENMLESLALRCDGNHLHKSWKPIVHNGVVTYPTKEEPHILRLCAKDWHQIFFIGQNSETLKVRLTCLNKQSFMQTLANANFSQTNLARQNITATVRVWALHCTCSPFESRQCAYLDSLVN